MQETHLHYCNKGPEFMIAFLHQKQISWKKAAVYKRQVTVYTRYLDEQ